MDLKEKIIGITIGIRHARSFRVPDVAGEIIDDILYSKNSPFNAEFFPNVQETSRREKILVNPKTTEYLRINTDDVILGLIVDKNFEIKFNWIKDTIMPYFEDSIFKKYGMNNIKRFGIVFSHKLEKDGLLEKVVPLLTKEKIKEGKNINISFSEKDSVAESIFRKGVNDYKNYIYNFTELDGGILAELDYQYYYDPTIFDLRECFTKKILESAKTFLEKNYYTWLQNHENRKTK